MASIKAIEGRSIHQIQSGQVIVDLTSVVKELVENSLDAGSSKIDVRFKNHGIDSIEVQDDGNGIAPEDFPTVALKHHTSKLSSFEDLETLQTFGFRGEALSSLCALANVHIITARAQDGAVGRRLDFETSGKLKGTSVIAAQKGTTVSVENIFRGLPVRRKELEKNAKREWSKVLNFMYSYACIGVNVRFSISNQPLKGKRTTAFSTKGNPTTRENIANVFNVKTLAFLVKLDLELELEPSSSRLVQAQSDKSRKVFVEGHVSRPAYGEGRQTPDRQMYFVNSRPCLLPQISKVFNEVYKSFNHHQSPFVLANFVMDTNAYDVNVSPDKKSIMLHDQTALLEKLKTSLTDLFQNADHTLPQSQLPVQKLPSFQPLKISRDASGRTAIQRDDSTADDMDVDSATTSNSRSRTGSTASASSNLIEDWVGRDSVMRREKRKSKTTRADAPEQRRIFEGPQFTETVEELQEEDELLLDQDDVSGDNHAAEATEAVALEKDNRTAEAIETDPVSMAYDEVFLRTPPRSTMTQKPRANITDPSRRMALSQPSYNAQPRSQRSSQRGRVEANAQDPVPSMFNSAPKVSAGPINDAFARMRPRRPSTEATKITIGDATPTVTSNEWSNKRRRIHTPKGQIMEAEPGSSLLSQTLFSFAAPGSQLAGTVQSSRMGIYDEHSDSDAELTDESGLFVQSGQGSAPSSVDRAAFDLGLLEPSTGISNVPSQNDELDLLETEEEKRLREDEMVAKLIQDAELPKQQRSSTQRNTMASGSTPRRKDLVFDLACRVHTSIEQIKQDVSRVHRSPDNTQTQQHTLRREETEDFDAETKLSLTVNKADFERMTIVGQFNLGFILAVRPACEDGSQDELFIIDQHAADEKSNYERLQKTVRLQSQPLVQPKLLDLTAVEEEVVTSHPEALKANGFEIEVVDEDDTNMDGRTYRLLTLPTSRETTFKLSDLEELMHLLSEVSIESSEIPRPRKVQKMLAMRACRSSIMVGKTLTMNQMTKVVQHMGTMEKPWNCPHGRPTMRHLTSLGSWHSWKEGQWPEDEEMAESQTEGWKRWMHEIS